VFKCGYNIRFTDLNLLGVVQLIAVMGQGMEGQNFTVIYFSCKSPRATSYWGRKIRVLFVSSNFKMYGHGAVIWCSFGSQGHRVIAVVRRENMCCR
jgi:hypothetical protein